MKTLWNKIPAWLKAILLLVITFYPVTMIVQGSIMLNLESNPTWSWAFLISISAWVLYWYLIKKFDPFKGENDIKLEWRFSIKSKKAWYRVIAMICLTYAVIQFAEIALNALPTQQLAFFKPFFEAEPFVAIPLLLAVCINAGFIEELVYRGFVQNTLSKAYGVWIAFIGVGLIFALTHFLPWSLVAAWLIVSMGYSLVAYELKSTAAGIWGHTIFDFLMLLNVYYNVIELNSTPSLYLSMLLLVIGLFFLLKDNKVFSMKSLKKSALAEVSSN